MQYTIVFTSFAWRTMRAIMKKTEADPVMVLERAVCLLEHEADKASREEVPGWLKSGPIRRFFHHLLGIGRVSFEIDEEWITRVQEKIGLSMPQVLDLAVLRYANSLKLL